MPSSSNRHSDTSDGLMSSSGKTPDVLPPSSKAEASKRETRQSYGARTVPNGSLPSSAPLERESSWSPWTCAAPPTMWPGVISRTEPRLAFTSRLTPKDDVDLGVPEITFEDLESAISGLPNPGPRAHPQGRPAGNHVHVGHNRRSQRCDVDSPQPYRQHRRHLPLHQR